MWSRAAEWRTRSVLGPLVVLALILHGALAIRVALKTSGEFQAWARQYDESYPPIIVENGNVRLEGGGVIRFAEGKSTFLVDPEETISLDIIETPEYVVVRKQQIIRRRPFRTETTEVADLQQFLPDPLRIDGPGIRPFQQQWGRAILLGFTLLVASFSFVGELLAGALYCSVGAGVAHIARGRKRGLSFGASFRIALAVYSLAITLDAALVYSGFSPGACMGLWIWSSLVSALAVWRVGR